MHKLMVLMGIKHCGKSTQGKLLASHCGCPFYDTDDVIHDMTKKSPRELYTAGVQLFRQAEAAACRSVVTMAAAREAVVATGGGICDNDQAVAILRPEGIFVFLETEEQTASDRIIREAVCCADGTIENLPSYIAKENPRTFDQVREIFHQFYIGRVKKYRSLCDIAVVLGALPKEENLQRITGALHR